MTRLHLDFRFVGIERELWALEQFLRVVEPQIGYLRDQDRIRTEAALREARYKWEDPETQEAFQDLDERAESVFPRFLRAPFLISLWACYESAIFEIAAERGQALSSKLRLRDIRGDDFLDGAQRYFDAVLGELLEEDPVRLRTLADLLVIRNILAHANGQARLISPERLRNLKLVLARHPSVVLDDDYLRPSPDLLTTCYAAVEGSLRALVNRIRGGPAVRPAE